MDEGSEYLNLTKMAEALGMTLGQLKKEMRLDHTRNTAAGIRRDMAETPHATIGGRPHMFWDTAHEFVEKS